MRFVIIAENEEVIAEYSSEDVKKLLNELLKRMPFEVAWDIMSKKLHNELRRK